MTFHLLFLKGLSNRILYSLAPLRTISRHNRRSQGAKFYTLRVKYMKDSCKRFSATNSNDQLSLLFFSFFTFCPLKKKKKITSVRCFKVFPFYRLLLAVGEVSCFNSLYKEPEVPQFEERFSFRNYVKYSWNVKGSDKQLWFKKINKQIYINT